jgi:hypothetical protein
METITITFCDRGENHIGNQQIGALAPEGFTYTDLTTIQDYLAEYGIISELYNLGDALPEKYDHIDAGLLIIRNGAKLFVSDEITIFDELRGLTYDKRAKMYGRVVNKKARHNLVFADFDQEPDYENGKGTVINYTHLPYLSHIRDNLTKLISDDHITIQQKLSNLVAEANHYYDIQKTFIGAHSDLERRIVVGLRLGASFPLYFWWYLNSKIISSRLDFSLNNGDIYFMAEKTCGFDGKKKKIPILRHAAGFEHNIK